MFLIMWAKSGFLFASRVVFLGEAPGTDPGISSDTSDLRRLLLERLEVLEAALLHLADVRGKAAQSTIPE